MNIFYSRFDCERDSPPPTPTAEANSQPLVVSEKDTRRGFSELNIREAAGPDGITPRFWNIVPRRFLSISHISRYPTVRFRNAFKESDVVPIAKKNFVKALNDCRHVALTSVIMESFDHLVQSIPCQFYQSRFTHTILLIVQTDQLTMPTPRLYKTFWFGFYYLYLFWFHYPEDWCCTVLSAFNNPVIPVHIEMFHLHTHL